MRGLSLFDGRLTTRWGASARELAAALPLERKFTAPTWCIAPGLAILRHYTSPDPTFAEGIVSSVYYDTPDLRAYHDKLNGTFEKEKIRLRWYSGYAADASEQTMAYIERKRRQGMSRSKQRDPLTIHRQWLNSTDLADDGWLLRTQVPPGLLPVLCIVYSRYRFVCPHTTARVSLDHKIHVSRINGRLFHAAALPAVQEIVLEIKDIGNQPIPWLGAMQAAGFRNRNFSKYGECVRLATT